MKERKRAEGGKKGAMRAFTASSSDHDSEMEDGTDKEAEQDRDRAHELGAAAPAAEGDKKYLGKQKEKREKAKSHAKEREEKRKRESEEKRKRESEKETQEISDDQEEHIDIREFTDLSGMKPQDFHKVLKQQDREIIEFKQEPQMQTEQNAVFSMVLTSQGAAQKRSEETAVLYSYELTGLPRDDTQEDERAFVMWCTSEAKVPDHEISANKYTDVRRIYGVRTPIIKFGNKGNRTKMSKWTQAFKARNTLKYYSRGEFWDQYKISGRYQETADQRERRDFLNVAWQILKELEGEDRLKSEEGAYLNYPKTKTSINEKVDNLPLIQFIYQEVTEGKIIDPTVRVYIGKGLWESEFELKFRQHYLREEEEQLRREIERRAGREGAAGPSIDYNVPRSMMRDKERASTWKMIFRKHETIEHHRPKFWEDVQSAASEITTKGKGWQREEEYKGGHKGQNQYKGGYKGQDKGGYKGKNQFRQDGNGKGKQYPHYSTLRTPSSPRPHRTPS